VTDIAVVVEHHDGAVAEVTFELLARARALAAACGGRVLAVAVGSPLARVAAELGAADLAVLCEDPGLAPYTPDAHQRALENVLARYRPRATLVASTTVGIDLAGGLAGALGWPLVAYCVDVRFQGDALVATSQIYGGKILADAEVAGPTAVLAVLPGAGAADEGRAPGPPPVEEVPAPAHTPRVRFKRWLRPEGGDVDITREPVLVAVGRGLGGPEHLPLAEELAALLGGVVAASRPVVDQGWLPRTRQVGTSGMTVKPRLYVALGISGAPEHLEGMRQAGLIVAINSDARAPIFDVAHYGVVGDLFEVVPALTEKLRAR
jgi:electron transfer flavoprotein alpha subunit